MMRIVIEYESSWRNSFLDGSNNEPLPKNGRNYVAASSNLNHLNHEIRSRSYKDAGLSLNTVLGVLCRLIGDQRKLYQARNSDSYYFSDLESRIGFNDVESEKTLSSEIVYLRNMTGSYDREAYTGSINTKHWLFTSNYSVLLWNLLFSSPKDLITYINHRVDPEVKVELDPRLIISRVSDFKLISIGELDELGINLCEVKYSIELLNKLEINEQLRMLFPSMKKVFSDIEYIKNEKIDFKALYCSALYLKLARIHQEGGLIKGNIKGFSVAGFTPKDFMSSFTPGKKKVYGNPYLKKERIKGEGEIKSMLTKASGKLEITLDIDRDKADELKQMIENAGVSAFYLGKKGLAYVSHIAV